MYWEATGCCYAWLDGFPKYSTRLGFAGAEKGRFSFVIRMGCCLGQGVLSVSTPTCTSVSSSGTGVVGGPGDVFTFGYQQEAGDAAVLYWSLYVIGKVLMSYLEVMS